MIDQKERVIVDVNHAYFIDQKWNKWEVSEFTSIGPVTAHPVPSQKDSVLIVP